ncbi:hypothetical protein ACHAW6_004489 [Cyclotella cf. meneghiniana]
MIIIAIISCCSLRQINFIMAYMQAPTETDLYMEIPHGIEMIEGNTKDYVLQLLANMYGQKQEGRLESIDSTQSRIDECVFYRDNIIFIVYVDDGIFFGMSDDQLSSIIKEPMDIGLQIDDQDHPADFLRVNIKWLPDGLTHQDFTKPVPARCTLELHAFLDLPPFQEEWNYRSAVGKLNYLGQMSQPDIQYMTHIVVKYSSNPNQELGQAILYIVWYLIKTRDLGLHFKPDTSKEFAELDPCTAKSRSGWFILYANCPVIWCSTLQLQVALSTTEAEYIAFLQALHDAIPIMALLEEMREHHFQIICEAPCIYCKAFEDNSGALELVRLPKLPPHTKHINKEAHQNLSHRNQKSSC